MSRTEARATLTQRLIEPLHQPLIIQAAGRPFPLSAREARISADLGAMVDAAVRRSREGGVLARTWRAISGEGLGARVTPTVAYSPRAVQRIVDRVRVTVSRPAKDARVNFAAANLTIRPSQSGRTIDAAKLRSDIKEALIAETDRRIVTAPVKRIAEGHGGEAGRRVPRRRDRRPRRLPAQPVQAAQARVPENPIKARWLGIYDGVGVHGTDARGSIGSNASHGCIRMLVEDVQKLYDAVPVGTPIFIH